ncbi:MAG: hypothetical protein JRJ84_09190 [Deltaproteobacteria bacterium]|nr:hypothetical protein [Deltaproteobacteria bacterium]
MRQLLLCMVALLVSVAAAAGDLSFGYVPIPEPGQHGRPAGALDGALTGERARVRARTGAWRRGRVGRRPHR